MLPSLEQAGYFLTRIRIMHMEQQLEHLAASLLALPSLSISAWLIGGVIAPALEKGLGLKATSQDKQVRAAQGASRVRTTRVTVTGAAVTSLCALCAGGATSAAGATQGGRAAHAGRGRTGLEELIGSTCGLACAGAPSAHL